MLGFMRKKAGSWMIKIILGAIVFVFVLWGGQGYKSRKANEIAHVNDVPIMYDEFRIAYNNVLDDVRRRFGDNLNDETIKMLGIEQRALEQLVTQQLVFQEAEKIKIKISDLELSETIRGLPYFQRDGSFDGELYQKLLSRQRMTPEDFENQQRQTMIMKKVGAMVTESVKVSDQEIRDWYNWEEAEVNIDYILYDPETYKTEQPDADALKSYFDENKTSYMTEPEIRVSYLRFSPEDYKDQIIITDEDLQDYYSSNPEEFKKPQTVEARHILLKLASDATPEIVEEKKIKATEIESMAKDGKDFAELAKQYSEGPTKDQGGYLGEFAKESMIAPFAEKAFSMKAGEISEPVRTQFGWHIIKVEKVNEETVIPAEEAFPGIREKLVAERAQSIAYDESVAVSDTLYGDNDFPSVASEHGIEVHTTNLFTRTAGPADEKIANKIRFAAAAFTLERNAISDVQEFDDGYYILQPVEKFDSLVPELVDVKEEVILDLNKDNQEKAAMKDAADSIAAIKNGAEFSAGAGKYNLKVLTTGFFDRNSAIPEIGYEPGISAEAFKLTEQNRVAETPLQGAKGYYVIKLKERKQPDLEELESVKAEIEKRLLQQKQMQALNDWVTDLKEKSEITYSKEFLDRQLAQQ
ncbi:MAG: SurA N-terminal domain-containing protein [Desulfobacterales bacterium]|nr:SurA N-terminal domain-containing protein [Desulfobacterales bacterium]